MSLVVQSIFLLVQFIRCNKCTVASPILAYQMDFGLDLRTCRRVVQVKWMGNVDRLTSMTVFAKVASARSFSGAGRELGISQATVSKHVQTLEDWFGARLLHRTTRRVALTDAGEGFFLQCSRILEQMEAARTAARPEAPVRGTMRITAPVVFGSTRLGPLVVDFLEQNPEVSTMHVELSDRSVDLIEEGYDLGIRTAPPGGAGLVAWPLMPLD